MSEQEAPWEGQCADAAYQFAWRCAVLAAQNPNHVPAPLEYMTLPPILIQGELESGGC